MIRDLDETLSKTIRDNHEAEKVMNSFPRAAAPLARAVGDNEGRVEPHIGISRRKTGFSDEKALF